MHWIKEPFRRCFDYSGRSRRMEYWSYALLVFVTMTVIGYIEVKMGWSRSAASGAPRGDREGGFLSSIVMFAFLIPGLAVAVRRLHDSDRVGWWLALPVAPVLFWIVALIGQFNSDTLFKPVLVAIVVSPLVVLAFMCLPGTKGPNRFGPDPKGPDLADTFA